MDFLDRAPSQLKDWFNSMTPTARATTALAIAAVIAGLIFFCAQHNDVPNVELMRGVPVSPSRLPAMKAALAKANLTEYEVRENAIFVPRGKEAAYMAALANANLLPPSFGEGLYKAVNEGGPFVGRQDRKERLKIAKQAELSLMIRSMNGIENAYVIYDEETKRGLNPNKLITAIASVKPEGDTQLDKARVFDIQKMLAGAIAGLEAENVTVADLNGRVWSGKLVDADRRRPLPPPNPANSDLHVPIATKIGRPTQPERQTTVERSESKPAFSWFEQPWSTIGLAGLGLFVLLTLRSIARAARRPAATIADVHQSPAESSASPVPAPHWHKKSRSETQSPRDELSQLVDEDPETAADILRNWIGQTN